MTTLESICNLMADRFALSEAELSPERTLESLGVDSLAVIELLFQIEDAMKINIPDQRIALETLQDLADYIDRLVAEQHSQGVRPE